MKKPLMILAATLSLGSVSAFAQTPPADPMAPPPTTTTPMTPTAPAPATADPGMSSPAPGDMGAPPPAASAMSATTPTPTDTSAYPTCTRGMTDKCVQKDGMAKKWKKKR